METPTCHRKTRGPAAAEEAPGAPWAGHERRGVGEGSAAAAGRLPLRALVQLGPPVDNGFPMENVGKMVTEPRNSGDFDGIESTSTW